MIPLVWTAPDALTTRRRPGVRGLGAAVLLVVLGFGSITPGAEALRTWCRSDPIVAIDGTLVDIFIDGPLEAPLLVTGRTEVVIRVPPGVRTRFVASDLGFGRLEHVRFAESEDLRVTRRGIQVEVRVFVPARDEAMPIRVEFAPRIVGILNPDRVRGTANEWITLRTLLEPRARRLSAAGEGPPAGRPVDPANLGAPLTSIHRRRSAKGVPSTSQAPF